MKKMFASLMMVLGVSAAVCAAEVSEIAEKALANVQAGTITMKGEDGWLYSRNELSHLAAGPLAVSGATAFCSVFRELWTSTTS